MAAPSKLYQSVAGTETDNTFSVIGPCLLSVTASSVTTPDFDSGTVTIYYRVDDSMPWVAIGTFDASSTTYVMRFDVPGSHAYQLNAEITGDSDGEDIVVWVG